MAYTHRQNNIRSNDIKTPNIKKKLKHLISPRSQKEEYKYLKRMIIKIQHKNIWQLQFKFKD